MAGQLFRACLSSPYPKAAELPLDRLFVISRVARRITGSQSARFRFKNVSSGSSSPSATIRTEPSERLLINPVIPVSAAQSATYYQKQSPQPVTGRTNGAADVLHQMISIAISSSISSSSSSSALRRSFADRGAASGVKSAFSHSINPIAHPSLTF